jgi:Zn-dependent M28 family amino/carboxypeptidase
VIIGSHWDTVDTTDGYNDNGSGVATLLELARLIVESKCRPKNSIVFVAFDLEEMGAQGSQEFVNRLSLFILCFGTLDPIAMIWDKLTGFFLLNFCFNDFDPSELKVHKKCSLQKGFEPTTFQSLVFCLKHYYPTAATSLN